MHTLGYKGARHAPHQGMVGLEVKIGPSRSAAPPRELIPGLTPGSRLEVDWWMRALAADHLVLSPEGTSLH
jgi:hypothetical protein